MWVIKVKNKGFTLIELMIAMMLGLIVVGGAISIYISTVASSANTIKSARLNHDLESAMSLMMNDIKRAGFWSEAADGNADSNPFTNADAAAGAITNINILENGTCILYSYDADEDEVVDNDVFYGFKFEGNSVKIRATGAVTNDCGNGVWSNFIDEDKLSITAVQFSFEPIDAMANGDSRCWNQTQGQSDDTDADICIANAIDGDYLIQNRMVNIKLTGELINDANVVKSLSGTVEVRNNRICTRSAAENCP